MGEVVAEKLVQCAGLGMDNQHRIARELEQRAIPHRPP